MVPEYLIAGPSTSHKTDWDIIRNGDSKKPLECHCNLSGGFRTGESLAPIFSITRSCKPREHEAVLFQRYCCVLYWGYRERWQSYLMNYLLKTMHLLKSGFEPSFLSCSSQSVRVQWSLAAERVWHRTASGEQGSGNMKRQIYYLCTPQGCNLCPWKNGQREGGYWEAFANFRIVVRSTNTQFYRRAGNH